MKNLLLIAILAGLAWFGYNKYQAHVASQLAPSQAQSVALAPDGNAALSSKCDGRTRCPQMTSCAEAKYFIQHCPNTEMDGDNDGVPCESQWCGSD